MPTEEQAPAPSPSRDAIIYIPGLFKTAERDAVSNIPGRIAVALDRSAASEKAIFSTHANAQATERVKGMARVTTIVRKDGAGDHEIIDVYEFDYRDSLIGTSQAKTPIVQAFRLGGTLLAVLPRLVGSLGRQSKTPSEKRQITYGVLLFLGLVVYMLFLLGAGIGALIQGGTAVPGVTGTHLPAWLDSAIGAAKTLIVLITAAGLFNAKGVRDFLDTAAAEASAAGAYLAMGDRVKTVQGNLGDVLERICEADQAYDRIHIVAFSFGSILAIDSVFPRSPRATRWNRLTSLVTVGCPFDFVRTYWPDYFGTRNGTADAPGTWFNVYTPADVLGSDFTDGEYSLFAHAPTNAKPTGVKLQTGVERIPETIHYGDDRSLSERGYMEWFAFAGFRAHGTYWDDAVNAESCFTPIVQSVFKNHVALS